MTWKYSVSVMIFIAVLVYQLVAGYFHLMQYRDIVSPHTQSVEAIGSTINCIGYGASVG